MNPFVTLSSVLCLVFAAAHAASTVAHPAAANDDRKTLTLNVYALDTCPISGQKLGSMGEPAVREYRTRFGMREVRFCCPPCIEPFEKDLEENMKKVDEKLIEQQKRHYPLENCIVSGRSLKEAVEDGGGFDMIFQGRLVRFCCPGCPQRFMADTDRYMKRLDEAIIKQQRENYPLENCVIAGAKLGSMGEPYEVIVGGTLVRFCCKGCVPGFREDPAKHLATIRDAWRKQHEAGDSDHGD